MKKILHIIEALGDFGGTPRKLLYLAELQKQHDVKNYFFCYLPSAITHQFEELGCEVINANTLRHDKLFYRLYTEAKRIQPDVICTHFTRPLILGSVISRFLSIPYVHSEHCSPNYRKGVAAVLSKLSLRTTKKIICNSNFTKVDFDKKYSSIQERSVVVYNPVKKRINEHNINIREELGIPQDYTVIGHVGGLVPWRDHITLLQAFSRIIEERTHCHLIIVGDGPCRKELEDTITTLNLNDAVSLVGYSENIASYLSSFNVFINPAIEEGFGIAVVEAMLAGLPVVLANAGAHPELVDDNKSGILYKKSDSLSLYEKIKQLIDQIEFRKKIGTEAKKEAERRFSLQNYAKNYYGEVFSAIS